MSYNDLRELYESERKKQPQPVATYNPQGLQPCHIVVKTRKPQLDATRGFGTNHVSQETHTVQKHTGYPTDLLYFDVEPPKQRVHPTQKPTNLLEWLVKTYSNEGETVLDNCMGSGSTGVACMNTGRNFIGMEQDAHYCRIATERITAAFDAAQRKELKQ